MKTNLVTRTSLLLAAASLLALPAQRAAADEIEIVRGALKADRKAVVAESMQFSEAEATAFWPRYGEYRAEMDKVGDGIVKLLKGYAGVYPNLPEDRAEKFLKDYLALEKDLVNVRARHLKKLTKDLSASKVLRFAQVENRLDLALRLQMASAVPLLPMEGRIPTEVARAAVTAEGVAGGAVVQIRQLTASVVAIDKAHRKLTLLSRDGIKQTVTVGPDAINFDQIRVGDTLTIEATEELVVQLAGPGEFTDDSAAALVALAPKGAKPGGVLAATTQVTGTVTALDPQKRTATLRFEDGTTRTFPVRSDVEMGKRKVGDKVMFRVTEMVAISVTKP